MAAPPLLPPPPVLPPVLILMACRNGARWLPGQLESIAAQDHAGWALWVADDGSTDASRAILARFAAARAGRNAVHLVEGPRAGSAGANFLALLTHPDLPLAPDTHVAFADQDDLWYPGKLSRALGQLAAAAAGPDPAPVLYGAQSRHVDAAGRPTGRVSRRPRRPVTLANALVQNLVSGHSAVLSPAALALARAAGAPPGIAFHDWWLSQLVLACGGRLLIDDATVLDYRQHGGNTLGTPGGMAAALARLRLAGRRDYARWIAANLAGLAAAPLTPAARATVAALRAAPAAGPRRLAAFRRLGLHRQSGPGTLALLLAALAGRA